MTFRPALHITPEAQNGNGFRAFGVNALALECGTQCFHGSSS